MAEPSRNRGTRVFFDGAIKTGDVVDLPEATARHLVQVLRLEAGDSFVIFNGEPGEFGAQLEATSKRGASARIGLFQPVQRESPLQITLAQCVSKGERMDFALQKAVELGATAIRPLISRRSVVRVDEERWEKKMEHWRGVVIAACEQSGRTLVPPVLPVIDLAQWLEQRDGSLRLILVPGSGDSLRALDRPSRPISVLIGPEGGLDDEELRSALHHGCEPVSLGPRILRTETAGIAALAALQAIFGDLA